MEYPKIHTLWKRDPITHKIIEGEYSKEEFASISKWLITEKIDGTNIRVYYVFQDPAYFPTVGTINPYGIVDFLGRTAKATIPDHLLEYLKNTFTPEKMFKTFVEGKNNVKHMCVTLYGEGYGPKIQNGHLYREDVSFILFDVKVGHWWLERSDYEKISESLNIDMVSDISSKLQIISNHNEIISYIKDETYKLHISKPDYPFEGIIARAYPMMLFRDGTPIMFKLKVKDYTEYNGN